MQYFCDNQRHLICVPYSVDNLHKMAEDLGIKRCWYHSSAKYKHYDIPKRRVKEIQAKCTVISTRELLDKVSSNSGGECKLAEQPAS